MDGTHGSEESSGKKVASGDRRHRVRVPPCRGDGNCAEAVEEIGVAGGVGWQKAKSRSSLRGR